MVTYDSLTVGWEAEARVLSRPGFCLLLPAWTSQQGQNIFPACLVVAVTRARRKSYVPKRAPSKHENMTTSGRTRAVQLPPGTISDARLQNKQKNQISKNFPPLFKPKLLCSNHFWLVKLKLSLHGVVPKLEEKKFRSFSKILEHCRDKNNNFWQWNH